MPLLGSLVMRYAAEGYQEVIRADRKVRDSVSETARRAKRDEGVTKGWLQRHKTALLAIAGALAGALYTIARESPSMSAALGEIRLAFSMFFMDVGERAAPFFEDLADLAWDLLEEWEKLPDSVKNLISQGLLYFDDWDNLLLDMAAAVDNFLGTGDTFQTLAQKILDTWDWLKENVPVVVANMFSAIGEEWEKFKEDPIGWGKGIVTGLIDGIRAKLKSLYTRVKDWIPDWITHQIKTWLPNAIQWGKDLLQNFIDGIRSKFGLLSSTVSTVWNMVSSIMSFDIARNDRMAFRWGADMVQHFEAGMR